MATGRAGRACLSSADSTAFDVMSSSAIDGSVMRSGSCARANDADPSATAQTRPKVRRVIGRQGRMRLANRNTGVLRRSAGRLCSTCDEGVLPCRRATGRKDCEVSTPELGTARMGSFPERSDVSEYVTICASTRSPEYPLPGDLRGPAFQIRPKEPRLTRSARLPMDRHAPRGAPAGNRRWQRRQSVPSSPRAWSAHLSGPGRTASSRRDGWLRPRRPGQC